MNIGISKLTDSALETQRREPVGSCETREASRHPKNDMREASAAAIKLLMRFTWMTRPHSFTKKGGEKKQVSIYKAIYRSYNSIYRCYNSIYRCYNSIYRCYNSIYRCYNSIYRCYNSIYRCYNSVYNGHRYPLCTSWCWLSHLKHMFIKLAHLTPGRGF